MIQITDTGTAKAGILFFPAVLIKVSIYTVKTHNKRAKKVDGKIAETFCGDKWCNLIWALLQ